jgi:hypothetical protein
MALASVDHEAYQDVARLLESTITSVKRRLGAGVVFAPFAFALGPNGQGEEVASEDPLPSQALQQLSAAIAAGIASQRFRAAVVAFPSRVLARGAREKIDAIGLEVNHARLQQKRLIVPLEHDVTGRVRVIGKQLNKRPINAR